jgi:hypothetical protein
MLAANVVGRKGFWQYHNVLVLAFLVVAGGILLAMLVTVSTIVDNRFRAIHQGGSIGFTSMLIIVRFPSPQLCSFVCFWFPLHVMQYMQ